MYNIIQLNEKDLSELQEIAKELGLKKTSALKKEELVYKILDEQAIKSASQKANTDKPEGQTKKRARISVKKEGDKVYTATKDKALKLEAKTPEIKTRSTIKEVPESTTEVEQAPVATEEKPKAKRGRKPGSKNKTEKVKENTSDVKSDIQTDTKQDNKAITETERPIPVERLRESTTYTFPTSLAATSALLTVLENPELIEICITILPSLVNDEK